MARDRSDPASRPIEEGGSESVSRTPSVGLGRDEFRRGQDLIHQPVLAKASAFLALLVSPCVDGRPDWPSGQGSSLPSHGLSHCYG